MNYPFYVYGFFFSLRKLANQNSYLILIALERHANLEPETCWRALLTNMSQKFFSDLLSFKWVLFWKVFVWVHVSFNDSFDRQTWLASNWISCLTFLSFNDEVNKLESRIGHWTIKSNVFICNPVRLLKGSLMLQVLRWHVYRHCCRTWIGRHVYPSSLRHQ